MAQTASRRLQFVAILGFTLAVVGCKEGTTFSPSDPATVRERILEELNASPNLRTQAIAAGVTREVTFIRGGNPNETGELWRFLMDWTSDANHVTIAIYQTALDSRGLDTGCRVPGSLNATPASLFPYVPLSPATPLRRSQRLCSRAETGGSSRGCRGS